MRAAEALAQAEAAEAAAAAEVASRLAAGAAPLSKVAKEVAAECGVAKSKVYAEALRQKDEAKQQKREQRRRGESGTSE